ncbi:MAG: hypothetical protein K6A89_12390, partial [Treponema sp.]|nr:hypothetical protein [Treponema sp.]
MKNKFKIHFPFSFILIAFGILCIIYDAVLILINPGTFWDNFFSFTHIWSLFGLILIFVSIYKIKKGFWIFRKMKRWAKLTIVSLFSLIILVSFVNLLFILTPKINRME